MNDTVKLMKREVVEMIHIKNRDSFAYTYDDHRDIQNKCFNSVIMKHLNDGATSEDILYFLADATRL